MTLKKIFYHLQKKIKISIKIPIYKMFKDMKKKEEI